MESLIPNSFQVPNLVVDELAGLLDPEEFLVVAYLCRRTFGFHKRQDRISLSQFTDGTMALDGRRLDHGTGLGRATVRDRLASLKQFGIVRETAPNNAQNEGAEYALQLDPAKIDFPGLIQRRARETETRRHRTETARQTRHQPATSSEPSPPSEARAPARALPAPDRAAASGAHPPQSAIAGAQPPQSAIPNPQSAIDSRSVPQTGARLCDRPVGGLSDSMAPRLSDRPEGVCGTDTQNPGETEGNPGREAWRHDPRTVDLYREMASPEAARRLLEGVGVSQSQLDYLTASPQRCYWACFWATTWPAVEHRIANATKFIRARVEGACAGKQEDREPPSEWEPYEARMRYESARRLQAEISARRTRERFSRPPIQFGEGAEPLWTAFRSSQRETDQAMLADTVRVDLEDGQLRITLCTVTSVECLARRKTTLIQRAREILPSFPGVQFTRGPFQEVSNAA